MSSPRSRTHLPLLSLLLALAFLAPHSATAQSHSGSRASEKGQNYALIFCTVWGADSRPAYGIKVRVRYANDKKFRWEEISNRAGEVAFRVPTGKFDYILEADVKPIKGKAKPQVTAHIENDERTDVGLHLIQ